MEIEMNGNGCLTNDCEQAECHRCFPRKNCEVQHEKCVDFDSKGIAYSENEIQSYTTNKAK